jgi:hypothetical protein
MAKKITNYIVWCPDHDGHATHFRMRADDYRLGTANYKSVGVIVKMDRNRGDNNTVVTLDTGAQFRVFSDWSAHKVESRRT